MGSLRSFSALDSETEHLIFSDLISKTWQDKTVIMTTHRLNLLASADIIYFMKNGRINSSGNFNDLLSMDSEFRLFCNQLSETTAPNFSGATE